MKIKSIKYIGKADVYNMEVKKHHNFLANEKFIVHNCIDAIRYALAELISKPRSTMADIAHSIMARKANK